MSRRAIYLLCNVLAAAVFLTALGYLLLGGNFGLGLGLAIIAVVITRVIVVDLEEYLQPFEDIYHEDTENTENNL